MECCSDNVKEGEVIQGIVVMTTLMYGVEIRSITISLREEDMECKNATANLWILRDS